MWEEFKPCSNMFPHIDGEILNDEAVIIHSFGSAGEPEVLEPYTGVCFPGVSGNVGGWSEALWKRRSLDATTKGPWPRAICAMAMFIWSVTTPRVRVPTLLDGQDEIRAACSHRHSINVIIMSSMASIVDDAVSVMVQPNHHA